ncbi:MAG TPA: hypothetical protein VFP68_02450 [Burkholderiaceae bacterium]|nr:hypothetical protein [Burkholderiaceae bacterium]
MIISLTSRKALAALFVLSAGAVVSIAHARDCRYVRGVVEETQVSGSSCLSPVALCTVAQMHGPLKGQARFTATSILTTADTPVTGVVFVTGDTVIADARLGSMRGSLTIKNAAAFRTVGDGDLSDTQVITGGTGDFAGANGSVRVSGTFANGSGTATFEGTLCVP